MSVRAVVALDKSIAIRTARWTDRHLDAKAVQQAHQWRGKLSHLTSDKARVAIQRDRFGPSLLAQGLDNSLKRGFGSEILVHLSIDQDRGAGVDGIEHFDNMLLLAIGLSWHGRDILEVELPGSRWFRTLNGRVASFTRDGNAAMLTEDLPDGAGGTGQTEAKRLELRIMRQEI